MGNHVRALSQLKQKEGDPHKLMKTAFRMRLEQLFPDARIIVDRHIHNLPLRPDIYVLHTDGRKWAFEVIYTNTRHLLAKHEEYVAYQIDDVWIMWNELRPKSGRKYPNLDQGILPAGMTERARYSLKQVHHELLAMQKPGIRQLYSFTLNPFYSGKLVAASEFMTTALIGIDVYEFADVSDGGIRHQATCDFVSMADVVFDRQGHPQVPVSDPAIEYSAHAMGFDLSGGFVVADLLERVDRLLTSPADLRQAIVHYIAYKMSLMPTHERQEIVAYMKSGNFHVQGSMTQYEFSQSSLERMWRDSEMIHKVLPDVRMMIAAIEQLEAPQPFKRLMRDLIDPKQMQSVAEFMEWQAKSKRLQRVRSASLWPK